ncbi:hypothetical protein PVAP13_7KG212255 [Panicum virgatum]|uniref:Uncharacterized protein n=1 Tax=Panicum virgatum TaxID=38727 RepID=A0A8T0QNM7_PANVG|nr:hypothetical protein PVAP13_7KG212255 [Panicum virgatum]
MAGGRPLLEHLLDLRRLNAPLLLQSLLPRSRARRSGTRARTASCRQTSARWRPGGTARRLRRRGTRWWSSPSRSSGGWLATSARTLASARPVQVHASAGSVRGTLSIAAAGGGSVLEQSAPEREGGGGGGGGGIAGASRGNWSLERWEADGESGELPWE